SSGHGIGATMNCRVMKCRPLGRLVIPLWTLAVATQLVTTVTTVTAQLPPPANKSIMNTVFPIDLPTVLRLANAQNLDVQIARQRLEEAKAQNDSAAEQFLPWISPAV